MFVNMTDKFMSGWGGAKGGKSYMAVLCTDLPSYTAAEVAGAILYAAQDRKEMRRVDVGKKPRTGKGSHTQITEAHDLGGPWLEYAPRGMKQELRRRREIGWAVECLIREAC